MVKVLVTGGAGVIGSNFVRYALRTHADWHVTTLDKLTYCGRLENLHDVVDNPRHTFVLGDIADSAVSAPLVKSAHIVVHFAAETHVDRSLQSAGAFIHTDVFGTFALLEAARQATGLRRFIQISTDEVYGSVPTGASKETDELRPRNPYSASKAASDHLVRAYHHTYGLPVLTTNCSNNYGPYHFPEKLIPLMIVNALASKPLPVYGDGQQIRDWLYVKDHCSAIRRVLAAGRIGEVYNIGGCNEKPNIEIVHTVCALLDELRPLFPTAHCPFPTYRSLITYVADRPGHDRRYAIDASKIEHELGWKPAETFETGIRKTVQWYLDNQSWVSNVQSGVYRTWVEKNYQGRG